MIQYKGFYLDLETDGENVYFVFSDTDDQKENVWKVNSRNKTIDESLSIVNKYTNENLAFKIHISAVNELNKIYPNSWQYSSDDNGEPVILFEDKPIYYPLRGIEESTGETLVEYFKNAATKTAKK